MKNFFPLTNPNENFKKTLKNEVFQTYGNQQKHQFNWKYLFGASAALGIVFLFSSTLTSRFTLFTTSPTPTFTPATLATLWEIEQEINELDFMVDSDSELADAIEFSEL